MFKRLSATYKALLLSIVGYGGFAISDAAVKLLTPYYSTYQIISCDLILASCILLLFSPKLGGLKTLRDPQNMRFHLLRALGNLLGAITIVYLFSLFPLTSVYTVIFLMPFIMALLAIPIYKERVGPHRWLAMLIGFSGILIAFQPWKSNLDLYLWLPLLAAPLFFGGMHLVMRSIKGASDLAIGLYPTAVAGICALPLVFLNGDFILFTPAHFSCLLVSALGIATGFLCVSKAFHRADASLIAPMQYTQMIWGIVFGILLFGDIPKPEMLLGATIIIASGIYLIRKERVSASVI
ncbi:MAG: DMT family transporter [Alphaproteobacteria bacterium]|nr:DMT family transporter [Alphaproteobacteria bacterium]